MLLAIVFPARADVLVLLGGDELRGTIVESGERYVTIYHDDLGRLTILRDKIRSIRYDGPAGEASGPASSTDADAGAGTGTQDSSRDGDGAGESAATADRRAKHRRRDRWELSLTLGGVFTNDDEGEKISLNTAFDAKKITPTSETDIYASYFLKFDDGDMDDHEATVLLNQRWRRAGSRWYSSVRPRYDFDEFRSWTHRLQIHGAAGYYLKETPEIRWAAEVGAGFRRDFGALRTGDVYEGLVGTDIDWQISDEQELAFEVTYYPQFRDPDHRLVTRGDWRIRIAENPALNFRIGLEHEFATDPDPGFPRNNVRLTTGIELKF